MSDSNERDHLRPWDAAYYRIEVEGYLEEDYSGRIAELKISYLKRAEDHSTITCLVGRVMDQAELTGVLNSLAEMHLPILKVENINYE